MQLQLQTFSNLVSSAAAAVQGAAQQLLDLTVGSTLRAILEANAAIALWLQWLILQVLQMTRAATSQGADLDTWMADFMVRRLPAVAANGSVTFTRFVPASSALVPVGTTVRTSDGVQSYLVTADPTNAAFSASQNGYVLTVGTASATVPIVASVPGSAGNAQPGAVSLIAAALPGIDTVTNATTFQGGLDGESDAALRLRFQNFLTSRARATTVAIGYAIASVQQALQYTIQENTAADGSMRMGSFVVTVDDGSGDPPAALLSLVGTAIETMRPAGSTFVVQPPVVLSASVAMNITTVSSAVHANIAAIVIAAITAYVNSLPVGTALAWSRLTQIAYQASGSVTNVTDVLLNGGTADLSPALNGVVKAATVTVN